MDLDAIERYWIERVRAFFAAKPFRLRLDGARGLRAMIADILAQAEDRQKATPGVHYLGSVLQHLVGASLECGMGAGRIVHNCVTTSDQQSGRAGDFRIGDCAIHVTTAPGEAVIGRCRDNLDAGLRPILVTMPRGLAVCEALADNAGIGDRIDVCEIEQFIALNLHQRGEFSAQGRRAAVEALIARYNAIVEAWETDPSLKIEIRA